MKKSKDPRVSQDARVRILQLIDRRRAVEGDDGIGASIERQILADECQKLERISSTEFFAVSDKRLQ